MARTPTRSGSPLKARAIAAFEKGDAHAAAKLAADALKKTPRDGDLAFILGSSQIRLGMVERGMKSLDKARTLGVRAPGLELTRAQGLKMLQRFDEMREVMDGVLARAPNDPQAVHFLATALRDQGRFEEGLRVAREPLARGADHAFLHLAHAELCVSARLGEEGVAAARAARAAADSTQNIARSSFFLEGALLDMDARYAEAFEAYSKGNGLTGPAPGSVSHPFAESWTPERHASTPEARTGSELPAFIVGMPRSGTTLLEQVLLAHPRVGTIGESLVVADAGEEVIRRRLDQRTVDRLSIRAMGPFQTAAEDGISRVVDKLPDNCWYLGFISKILPGSRVVLMERDPRDVCLSCFFQNFGAAHPFSRSLETCARRYAEYERMIERTLALPGVEVCRVRYPDLVAYPEDTIAGALFHLGLDPDPACLRFYENTRPVTTASAAQVRRPLYGSSVARWMNYEDHLAPLVDGLRACGVALEDAP